MNPAFSRTSRPVLLVSPLVVACLLARGVPAEVVTMRNGMRFEGSVAEVAGVAENPLVAAANPGEVSVKQIVVIDDNLRRVFVPQRMIASVAPSTGPAPEIIRLEQRVMEQGRRIAGIGDILRITTFDDWGRRLMTLAGGKTGRIDLVQGITEVTPLYYRVQGLQAADGYVCDMRYRTSNLPREMLSRILMHHIDPKNLDQRLKIVRLYMQAERYRDAREELEEVLRDFPDLTELKRQVTLLNQLSATKLIREIELRQQAGQHQLARQMLESFPAEGVGTESLLRVRDMIAGYEKREQQLSSLREQLARHLAALTDDGLREKLRPTVEFMQRELSLNTIERLADYLRLADDPSATPDMLLSLAISGWYLGGGRAVNNLAIAADLPAVHQLVVRYLQSEPHERSAILQELAQREGSSPEYLASLVEMLKPDAGSLPEPVDGIPGLYLLERPGLRPQSPVRYLVQLPPEYDPYRRYPCVVTLHGLGWEPQRQIDWWSGPFYPPLGVRMGQAARHGFIVIAPYWMRPEQTSYESSLDEHAAVLLSLRDACRRFAVDTDRVFLSGHGIGGDAAWDIALAHPDLWAGLVAINATARKYVTRYWENASRIPMYFVFGELDATANGTRIFDNATDLDRYLTRSTGGFDVTVVEYRGRGAEHFADEIQEIFTWMTLPGRKRDFWPREFTAVTMRPWDAFFWWVELGPLPERFVVLPTRWPDPKARPAPIEARALPNNRVVVRTGAESATVYLSPQIVDFKQNVTVVVNGREVKSEIRPSSAVLLEDVRNRCDRQHPFWAMAKP
ncbi:MAG: peptidase [Nitrospiraceae bacterium]|nr:MAG: peptidase [Nitrospiraceae bacterium]